MLGTSVFTVKLVTGRLTRIGLALSIDNSDRASELSPVSRHRHGVARSLGLQAPPGSYSSRTHQPPDCIRDTRESGREFIRELTRERPDMGRRWPNHPRPPASGPGRPQELVVDAIFSAHSDGLVVIIRKSSTSKYTPVSAPLAGALPTLSSARSGSTSSGSSHKSSPPSHGHSSSSRGSPYSYSSRNF